MDKATLSINNQVKDKLTSTTPLKNTLVTAKGHNNPTMILDTIEE